eukprot:gene13636-biopygen12565
MSLRVAKKEKGGIPPVEVPPPPRLRCMHPLAFEPIVCIQGQRMLCIVQSNCIHYAAHPKRANALIPLSELNCVHRKSILERCAFVLDGGWATSADATNIHSSTRHASSEGLRHQKPRSCVTAAERCDAAAAEQGETAEDASGPRMIVGRRKS